ncbi:MAG: DMT family transporter, partial [Alphaproteobacteria bacterium]
IASRDRSRPTRRAAKAAHIACQNHRAPPSTPRSASRTRSFVIQQAVNPQSNWWAWTGGFFGAIYFLVPGLGAAFFIALLVAGQMIGSIAFDHFGLLGLSEHPIDLPRVIGATLLVVGVVLIR